MHHATFAMDPDVTIDAIEEALDRLALSIEARPKDAWRIVPLYRRLESDLTILQSQEDILSSARARAAKSRGRKVGLS